MYVCNRSSDIVLDARIRSYNSDQRGWRGLQDYFVELIASGFIVFIFVTDIK